MVTHADWNEVKVDEVMQTHVTVVPAYFTMSEAADFFVSRDIQSAPVVDETGRCVGILSAMDFVRWQRQAHQVDILGRGVEYRVSRDARLDCLQIERAADQCVSVHMSRAVQTICEHASLVEAARVFAAGRLHHLPVVDRVGRPVGWLSGSDVLASACAYSPEQVATSHTPNKPR